MTHDAAERPARDVRPDAERAAADRHRRPANPFSDVYFTGLPGRARRVRDADPGRAAARYVRYNPADPVNPAPLLLHVRLDPRYYAPDGYTYTDPYGTAYSMAASGELQVDHGSPGQHAVVRAERHHQQHRARASTFERDAQGRITKVDYAAVLRHRHFESAEYAYAYDAQRRSDDGATCRQRRTWAPRSSTTPTTQHRLLTTSRPARQPGAHVDLRRRTGGCATDKDALEQRHQLRVRPRRRGPPRRRIPDTGVVTQTFDARGLLLSETDQLGHTTTHEYDANRNETKRTNAARRGDDRDLRRARQPDVGDRPARDDAHDVQRLRTCRSRSPIASATSTTIDYDDRGVPIALLRRARDAVHVHELRAGRAR